VSDAFAWQPGERETFASTDWDESYLAPGSYLDELRNGGYFPRIHWSEWTPEIWATATTDWECKLKIAHGPEDIAFATLDQFHREHAEYPMRWLCIAVARFELRALPWVLVEARTHPKAALAALGPFDVAALAPCVAGVMHTKKHQQPAEAWLARHLKAAREGLIADAERGKAKPKKAARLALDFLGSRE
jgi:hypothetical protein